MLEIKEILDGLRGNRGKWKSGSHWKLISGHLACVVSALLLNYDNWTATSPHNPLYVLHMWYRKTSVIYLPQWLSTCCTSQPARCPGLNSYNCWPFHSLLQVFHLKTSKISSFILQHYTESKKPLLHVPLHIETFTVLQNKRAKLFNFFKLHSKAILSFYLHI